MAEKQIMKIIASTYDDNVYFLGFDGELPETTTILSAMQVADSSLKDRSFDITISEPIMLRRVYNMEDMDNVTNLIIEFEHTAFITVE
jgi:hypothetical protein